MKKSEAFESVTLFVRELKKEVLFPFVWVNEQIAFRDVLVPVRFFTPFSHRPSRPCGTPRVYQISRPEIPCSYIATPDVFYRAQTVPGPDSVRFPRRKTSLLRNDVWVFQGSMSPWSQDEISSPRRGGSERWKGESGAVPPPRSSGKAKSPDVASSIPECSSELSKLSLTQTKWNRTKKGDSCPHK
jgi:hypothetical protein